MGATQIDDAATQTDNAASQIDKATAQTDDASPQIEVKPQALPLRVLAGVAAMISRDQWATILAVQMIVATALLRLLWLNQPADAVIFDETYYVNAARVILAWPVSEGKPYANVQAERAGTDPNVEHPPLAKVIIAGSMRLFGDNSLGWRLPSVLFGTLAVGIMYLLVLRLTARRWLALFAAFLFSFDNLSFVHGRIATLDIHMVAMMLLGLYFYAAKRPALAGGAVALSTLMKFNGIFALAAILGFEGLRLVLQPDRRARLLRSASDSLVLLGSFTIILLAVLWPLDRFFAPSFSSPVDHLSHIYSYGVNLRNDGPPKGIESRPWQWLMNEKPITYFKTDVNTVVDGNVVSVQTNVHFRGEMNPYIIATLPLGLGYLIYASVKKSSEFAMLMLALFAVTYLQPLATWLVYHRISYIFYFLPVLPALCAGIAYFLHDLPLPRIASAAYTAAVLFGFLALFPFRTFLW